MQEKGEVTCIVSFGVLSFDSLSCPHGYQKCISVIVMSTAMFCYSYIQVKNNDAEIHNLGEGQVSFIYYVLWLLPKSFRI